MYEFINNHPVATVFLVLILCDLIYSLAVMIFTGRKNDYSFPNPNIIINADNSENDDDWSNKCNCNNVVVINGKRYCCLKNE